MPPDTPERSPTFDQELFHSGGLGPDQGREGDSQRIARISEEIARGFTVLAPLGPAVSIFGSARTPRDHPTYAYVRNVAAAVGRAGFTVITGGGYGLMEAANRGARDAGAPSVGCLIELPHEEQGNEFLDVSVRFTHFFARKLMFVRYSSGFIVTPGGYGTLDELFEALVLMQTSIIPSLPVVLAGDGEWDGLLAWLRTQVLADGRISPADIDSLHVLSDPEEIAATLVASRPEQLADAAEVEAGHSPD